MAAGKTGTIKGTGTDPLGRYPKDAVVTDLTGRILTEALDKGWVVQEADTDTLAEAKAAVGAEPHVPTTEGRNVVRADRPFTVQEAAAIDAANRKVYAERRAARFRGRVGR